MELKLRDGQYALSSAGIPETVSGAEEMLQRVLARLQARRGTFWPDPSFGSRLYTLGRVKPGQREAAARQFAAEALAEETDVVIESVAYIPGGEEGGSVAVTLSLDGRPAELTLEV